MSDASKDRHTNGFLRCSHLVMGMCRNRVIVYEVFHIFFFIFLLCKYLRIIPKNFVDEW